MLSINDMLQKRPAIDLERLSAAVWQKRSGRRLRSPESNLRQVSQDVGLSAATLSRVERGAMPDLEFYVKPCRWLGVPLETFVT